MTRNVRSTSLKRSKAERPCMRITTSSRNLSSTNEGWLDIKLTMGCDTLVYSFMEISWHFKSCSTAKTILMGKGNNDVINLQINVLWSTHHYIGILLQFLGECNDTEVIGIRTFLDYFFYESSSILHNNKSKGINWETHRRNRKGCATIYFTNAGGALGSINILTVTETW